MIDNKKCMGVRRYLAQCLECQRLPRTPEDEDTGPWYNPKAQKGDYCNMQRKVEKDGR